VTKFACAVGVLAGLGCSTPSRPGELGSSYHLVPEGGADAGPLVLAPIVSPSDDPTTCAQAAALRSYVGCDYWPTVVANPVWSIFDFAVVVANAGPVAANVSVTGAGVHQSQTVPPNMLAKFFLPWVPALKGEDSDVCGEAPPLASSVLAPGAAYHLVSTVPVTVYQFNALEYGPIGGPQGKDWASCPGNQVCTRSGTAQGCFSFTNDSSLLLPSTAMTGHYRVTGYPGSTIIDNGVTFDTMGGYFAITGTVDGTHVKVALAPAAHVMATSDDAGIPDTPGGGEVVLTLNAGDVAELAGVAGASGDVSGSLVAADQPVQVIAGTPCTEVPTNTFACDHLEQSVFPAETLGKRYFVSAPTGPNHTAVGRVVRIYGNVDGTVLTYAPVMPPGCPATIGAGEVGDCGVVSGDFEVSGSSEFAVGTFMQGGSVVDPNVAENLSLGDPSESLMASVEQYRTKYVFLAPPDYSENFADIVTPVDAAVVLDGTALRTSAAKSIADGYGVLRISLNGINIGSGGAHVLESSAPVGVQVLGYGRFTSYQYPAGLNLKQIAPPPPNPP
jgi:hypothetical protein